MRGGLAGLCVLCGLATAACAGKDAERSLPPAELTDPLQQRVLGNGLELVVAPRAALPVVTVLVVFRSGALVEAPEQSGYSHLLEHMLFQGSAEVPDETEYRMRLQALGISTNAFTGVDYVMYYGLVPRENLDAGMALLAGALREPSIARDALAQEIEVVLAEFDLNDSDSEAVIRRRVLDLLFAPLANRKQPIGDRDVIAAATPDKLRALYDRYYVPNNALLVLSGDIDAARGSALAKKYFGDWKRGPDPFKTRPVPKFPPLARDAVDVVSMQRNDSRLVVAWQGPDPAHDDRAALAADLIGPIALQSSQFFRSTVGGGVIGAGLGFTRATRTGMLSAELEITSGEESAAVSRLRAVLNGLPDSITDEQVETAKDTIWSARFSNADASSGAAFQIAGDWAYSGFDYHSEYLDRLYDLTREDVVDVLERYVLGQPKAAVLSGKALSPDSAGVPQLKEPW